MCDDFATIHGNLGRKTAARPAAIAGMLLLGLAALGPTGVLAAEPGAGPAPQLAQTPPNPTPDQPERSPEQREAERRLEREAGETEDQIDQQRDEFERSEDGEDARERIDEAREDMERRREDLEREREEFENDPDETSCCNPGYKEGVLRAFDRQIERLEEEFERERRRILDEEMKKKDAERAAVLDGLKERLQRILDELKRLRDMPPLPPPGLTWGGFPDDGAVVLAMLPGVSFAGSGDPRSDPRVRRALMDQGGSGRMPALSVPRVPTMQPHMPRPNVEIVPTPHPPMEVIPR
jgi:hypothetical protein